MPSSFPSLVPSSVMETVEWPLRSFSSSTSWSVASGGRLESLETKPALYPFTLATMAASLSMDWEP